MWRNAELEQQIERLTIQVNEFGYDAHGFHAGELKRVSGILAFLYNSYFRTEVEGVERVPPGRALLVANHGGLLPFDAMMVFTALLMDAEPPRLARAMVDRWVARLPFVNTIFARCGQVTGLPENCRKLLENDELVLVFPEGAEAIVKPWDKRYQLQEFGTGFLRLAAEAGAPIVPVAIVGPDEQFFTITNFKFLAKLLRFPAFPITPSFPLAGPLGLIPLPVRYHIRFGVPLAPVDALCETDHEDGIGEAVERIRGQLADMINGILAARESLF